MLPKFRLKPCCVALAASVLIACGGGSSTPSTPPPGPPQHFLYAHGGGGTSGNSFSATIYGFGEDATGALTPLPSSPFTITLSGLPFGRSLATDLQGRFLFANYDLSSACCPAFGWSCYAIDSNMGTVSSSGTTVVDFGQLVFHPSGRFLYSPITRLLNGAFFYHGFAGVDLSTPNLAPIPGSPFSDGQGMDSVSVEPTGHYLYTSGKLDPTSPTPTPAFETYTIDSATGAATLLSTVSGSGVQPSGRILFHPSGRFGYALNTRSGSQVVDLYSLNAVTGALTFISTQTNGQLVNPLLHPSGNYLYGCFFAVGQPCSLVGYRVDSNTGTLTAISGFNPGGVDGSNLVIDKSGRFAYALSSTHQIFVYSIDSSTGLMTQMPNLTVTVPPDVTSIAAGR